MQPMRQAQTPAATRPFMAVCFFGAPGANMRRLDQNPAMANN